MIYHDLSFYRSFQSAHFLLRRLQCHIIKQNIGLPEVAYQMRFIQDLIQQSPIDEFRNIGRQINKYESEKKLLFPNWIFLTQE